MKTEISEFCKEYSSALIPAGAALDAVIEQIEKDSQEDVLRLNLAGLNEVKHRLKSLIDKVEGQQAYLLIFGPLKSGKSTLMNAISGAYVSEVTSLPAYPCLVYVSHGEKASIKLTRYNGRETSTEDKNVMEVLINDSHSNLADRIRTVEEQGREFDPGLDYPEAIRRINIGLEARELNESGTVLVDTPGLYSRMKFGYDLMTREFRNSAACAVFVVKTDNLFLEQVFDEFNDLLGLFSRVFLVVNIDSSKRDLRPDGSLQPSLESQDPQKIIDAFQLLSMSAALRKASKDGRLKIYPIDLLQAASHHLQTGVRPSLAAPTPVEELAESILSQASDAEEASEEPTTDDPSAEASSEASEAVETEPAVKAERPNDFGAFLTDLTEYLNSSDYLFELMNDSFRQGDALREEISRNCAQDSIGEFVSQQRRLRSDVEEISGQLEAASNLAAYDWEKAFEKTHKDVEQETSRFAKEVQADVLKTLNSGIENWFETSDCLADLVGKTWQKRMDDLQGQISEKVVSSVKNVLDSSSGGAHPDPDLVIALDRVRLSLRDVYSKAIGSLDKNPEVRDCAIELDVNEITVNRNFWDRIFFQSQAKIRRRLFGNADNPTNEVPPVKKRKRLLPAGREALEKCVAEHLNSILPGIATRCARDFLKLYIEQFRKDFTSILTARQSDLKDSKDNLESRIEANDRITGSFEQLDIAIESLQTEMDDLKNKFLRAARLARGFQVLESRRGAFSVWTEPYLGGTRLVPSGSLVVPEPVVEEEVVESDDSSGAAAPVGAFTIWTQEYFTTDGSEAESGEETASEEEVGDAEVENSDQAGAEDGGAPVVVQLPEVDDATEDGSEVDGAEVEAGEGEASDSSESSEPIRIVDADEAETAEVSSETDEDSEANPLRVVPKESDSE